MSNFVDIVRSGKAPLWWFGAAVLSAIVLVAMILPSLHQSRLALESDRATTQLRETASEQGYAAPKYAGPTLKAKPAMQVAGVADQGASSPTEHAEAGRKIIRTCSMQIVVQHPMDAVNRLTALAQSLGGYVQTSEGGGDNAAAAELTISVPARQFEQVRSEIRKLGLRVENEKVESQDVTQRYVDQDAGIHNLKAEEAQYLTILKDAHTVKDMLAVSEKLSDVRGQIEQEQAEFNALSQQVETVSLTIALHTEPPAQTFSLNWHPGHELKLALHDGLESLATYATAMVGILFYLPSVFLWTATILGVLLGGWKTLRWAGRRWFGWPAAERA